MQRFIHSIELALGAGDWYGALSTALIFPDICGRIEAPDRRSADRYIDWFNRYLLAKYTREIGPELKLHVFLSGEDCYSLRCSYLHEGGGNIAEQRARNALDSFHFISPSPGMIVHMNQSNEVLQLQVDLFCNDICSAVKQWSSEVVAGNEEIESRMQNLLEVHDSSGGVIF